MGKNFRTRQRFLPADHEWPDIREQYVTMIRAGYSAEEASKVITTRWLKSSPIAKAEGKI